jgi:hypothetical protein
MQIPSFKEFIAESLSTKISTTKSNNIPLHELYRVGSQEYYETFNQLRNNETLLEQTDDTTKWLIKNTDIGQHATYNGHNVPLDSPMRGGNKKFYVYTKDGDKVIKVEFGATNGLMVKFNDEKATKSFVARHKCSEKTDKTTAGFWSCNLPRFAKQLELSGGGDYYW